MEREIFKECTHNRAANLGTFQSDGCNQFYPHKILKDNCACCGCHRYYHRKVIVIDLEDPSVGNGGGFTSLSEAKRLDRLRGAATSPKPDASVRSKKTKFTSAQTEAMRAFADRVGWTMNTMRSKIRQAEVKRFCDSIGVNKFVFKNWLNYNKRVYGGGSTSGANNSSSSTTKAV